MALFKVFRGESQNLDSVTKVDGYAYFCTDDGSFWIDHAEGEEIVRTQINKQAWTEDIEAAVAASDEIYIGEGDMPENATLQIILDGSNEEEMLKNELKKYIDFLIESQISQLSSEIVDLPNNELLVQNVAQKVPYVKVAESPTFVDSVDEMTDISKMYVLKSDGMFYSYKAHTTTTPGGTFPNFTNQVPISTDTDGSIFNGTGYKEDVRLSSSGGISGTAQVGSVTTGFIPYTPGAFIRIKGAEIIGARDKYDGFYYINFYDANKALELHIPDFSLKNYSAVTTPSYDESTGAEVIDTSRCIVNDSSSARHMRASSYFRITAYGKGADLIVTVNEEITYTTVEGGTNTTYSWESTGISYNQPADYEDRVIAMENELEVLLNGTF